jgi:type I restriction enzyme, S subunit
MREGWQQLTLGDVAQLDVEKVRVSPTEVYRLAGVLNQGKGLLDRGPLDGAETNYAVFYRLRLGQLVMRKLTAWEGTLAVVSPTFEGHVVSTEFPTFSLNPESLLPQYMQLLCGHPQVWEQMRLGVRGTVQRRKRLNPKDLLRVVVTLPPLREQRRIADLVAALDGTFESVAIQAAELQKVISAMSSDLIEHTNLAPLGEVVSIDAKLADPKRLEYHSLPYVDIESIQSRTGDVRDLSSVGESAPISSKYLFTPEEVIYSKIRPELRKVAFPKVFGMCSADAYPLRVGQRMLPEFLLEVLLTERFSLAAIEKSGRTKMPKINRNELLSIEVPVPDMTTQRAVSETLGALRLAAKSTSNYMMHLGKLRAALLDELLSGEHEIPASYDLQLTA